MKYVLTLLAVLVVFAMAAPAADISGKWQAEMKAPDGSVRQSTFDFKQDGEKLTGTVTGGRGGPAEITDGKVTGDEVTFTVVRKIQEREMKMEYKGKIAGDQINFEVTGGRGNMQMTAKKAS